MVHFIYGYNKATSKSQQKVMKANITAYKPFSFKISTEDWTGHLA